MRELKNLSCVIFLMTKGNKLNEKISFMKTEPQNNSTNQLKQSSCWSVIRAA